MTQNTLNYYCYNSKLVLNCAFLTFSICINTKINFFHENLKTINKVTQNNFFYNFLLTKKRFMIFYSKSKLELFIKKINICSYM